MSVIDTIVADDITDKLSGITIANGFTNNVSVLDGYMVHYANDLLNVNSSLSFPAVAVQPVSDSSNSDSSNSNSMNTRVMKLIGAVSVSDPSLVNSNINTLLTDVRRSLAFDSFDNESKASEITLGNAEFNLPDQQDQYAFFEMSINIKYYEKWK